jgi:hypothetical protein
MKTASITLAILIATGAAQGQVMRPSPGNFSPVPSNNTAMLSETPQSCAERNSRLQQKLIPSLKAQLAALQTELASRKTQSFACSPDDRQSVSGSGAVFDCGPYLCNPVDGMCRTNAKTSADCVPGYLWDGFKSCVAAN